MESKVKQFEELLFGNQIEIDKLERFMKGNQNDQETAKCLLESITHVELSNAYSTIRRHMDQSKNSALYIGDEKAYHNNGKPSDVENALLFLPKMKEIIYTPFAELIDRSENHYSFNHSSPDFRLVSNNRDHEKKVGSNSRSRASAPIKRKYRRR